MFDSVCELFGETIRNVFGCCCYFLLNIWMCLVFNPVSFEEVSSQIRRVELLVEPGCNLLGR